MTFLVGHVLGSYYLGKINNIGVIQVASEKKRVLKLRKINYYTILLASYDNLQQAMALGESLALTKMPVVITGDKPYYVLLGCVNESASLQNLADSIVIDNKRTVITKKEINEEYFRFDAPDIFAEKKIAPFLGNISLCLEKGLLINCGISINDGNLIKYRNKFPVLAKELETVALEGFNLAQNSDIGKHKADIINIANRCQDWADSLKALQKNWTNDLLLINQQKALALISDYHKYIHLYNKK